MNSRLCTTLLSYTVYRHIIKKYKLLQQKELTDCTIISIIINYDKLDNMRTIIHMNMQTRNECDNRNMQTIYIHTHRHVFYFTSKHLDECRRKKLFQLWENA